MASGRRKRANQRPNYALLDKEGIGYHGWVGDDIRQANQGPKTSSEQVLRIQPPKIGAKRNRPKEASAQLTLVQKAIRLSRQCRGAKSDFPWDPIVDRVIDSCRRAEFELHAVLSASAPRWNKSSGNGSSASDQWPAGLPASNSPAGGGYARMRWVSRTKGATSSSKVDQDSRKEGAKTGKAVQPPQSKSIQNRRYLDASVHQAVQALERIRRQVLVSLQQLTDLRSDFPQLAISASAHDPMERQTGATAGATHPPPQPLSNSSSPATGAAGSSQSSSSSAVPLASRTQADGSVHVSRIECCACRHGDDDQGDELLLCDGAGCDRAWHLYCLPLPVGMDPPSLDDEDEDWLCPLCEAEGDALLALEAALGGELKRAETIQEAIEVLGGELKRGGLDHSDEAGARGGSKSSGRDLGRWSAHDAVEKATMGRLVGSPVAVSSPRAGLRSEAQAGPAAPHLPVPFSLGGHGGGSRSATAAAAAAAMGPGQSSAGSQRSERSRQRSRGAAKKSLEAMRTKSAAEFESDSSEGSDFSEGGDEEEDGLEEETGGDKQGLGDDDDAGESGRGSGADSEGESLTGSRQSGSASVSSSSTDTSDDSSDDDSGEDEDDGGIVGMSSNRPKRRAPVDYRALAVHMFGTVNVDETGSDGEPESPLWQPKQPRKRRRTGTGP